MLVINLKPSERAVRYCKRDNIDLIRVQAVLRFIAQYIDLRKKVEIVNISIDIDCRKADSEYNFQSKHILIAGVSQNHRRIKTRRGRLKYFFEHLIHEFRHCMQEVIFHRDASEVTYESTNNDYCISGEGNNYFDGAVGPTCECMPLLDGIIINSNNPLCLSGQEFHFPNGITLGKSYLTLDCKGSKLIGTGSEKGIYMLDIHHVTVQNCNIIDYFIGVHVESYYDEYDVDYISMSNNNISLNYYGIYLEGDSSTHKIYHADLFGNNIFSNNYGIYGSFFGNSIIKDNGTGSLRIRGTNLMLEDSGGNRFAMHKIDNEEITL